MSTARVCPCCGATSQQAQPARNGKHLTDPLTGELARIREMAEHRHNDAERQTIERLSREVSQLRETVARLRGCAQHT